MSSTLASRPLLWFLRHQQQAKAKKDKNKGLDHQHNRYIINKQKYSDTIPEEFLSPLKSSDKVPKVSRNHTLNFACGRCFIAVGSTPPYSEIQRDKSDPKATVAVATLIQSRMVQEGKWYQYHKSNNKTKQNFNTNK